MAIVLLRAMQVRDKWHEINNFSDSVSFPTTNQDAFNAIMEHVKAAGGDTAAKL
jgi:hypothetical protein